MQKKTHYLLVALFTATLLFVSTQSYAQKGATRTDTSAIVCDTLIAWDSINFCMPHMPGMVEASQLEALQPAIDLVESGMNSIMAYYLPDSVYAHFELHNMMGYDKYAVVFAVDALKGLPVGEYELAYFSEAIQSAFDGESWESISDELEESIDNMEFNTPVIAENYSPDKRVKSTVVLMDINVDVGMGAAKVTVCAVMNVVLVNSRALILTYYEKYEGKKSIKQAKERNEEILNAFLTANPAK